MKDTIRSTHVARWQSCLLLICMVVLLAGCSRGQETTSPTVVSRTTPDLMAIPAVQYWTGGTPTCAVSLDDGTWLLGMGYDMLHLEQTGRMLGQTRIGSPGNDGGIVDLRTSAAGDVYAVLEDSAIIQISRAADGEWTEIGRWSRSDIGVHPRRIEVIDNEVYVLGTEHLSETYCVVVLGDPRTLRPTQGTPRSLVAGTDGMLVTSGRRAYQLDDGNYVGSASLLFVLPPSNRVADASYVFIRNRDDGADIGLMNPTLREVEPNTYSFRSDESVRDAAQFGPALFIMTDHDVRVIELTDTGLQERTRIPRAGVVDVVQIDAERFALVGEFGWEVLRLAGRFTRTEGSSRQQDAFVGPIEGSRWNGAQLVLSVATRWWTFDPYQRMLVMQGGMRSKSIDALESHPVQDHVAVVGLEASISTGTGEVILETDAGRSVVTQRGGGQQHCLAVLERQLWCGHDDGVDVYTITNAQQGSIEMAARMRLPGAVRCMYPLVDGRHMIVITDDGGFGIVQAP